MNPVYGRQLNTETDPYSNSLGPQKVLLNQFILKSMMTKRVYSTMMYFYYVWKESSS
jgi:hypothetical protein